MYHCQVAYALVSTKQSTDNSAVCIQTRVSRLCTLMCCIIWQTATIH